MYFFEYLVIFNGKNKTFDELYQIFGNYYKHLISRGTTLTAHILI